MIALALLLAAHTFYVQAGALFDGTGDALRRDVALQIASSDRVGLLDDGIRPANNSGIGHGSPARGSGTQRGSVSGAREVGLFREVRAISKSLVAPDGIALVAHGDDTIP